MVLPALALPVPALPAGFLSLFGDAFNFVFSGQEAETGGVTVGGTSQVVELATKQIEVTLLALAVAIPIGIVVLIALALNRAWVRRSRRRVLGDDQ